MRRSVTRALHALFAPRSPHPPSLPDARSRPDRFRCGGRESKFLAVAFLVLAGSGGARADLVIVPTFDSTITSDANAVTIEAGINAAISRIESYIASPVTVAITFKEGSGAGVGGSAPVFSTLAYNPYLFRLNNNQVVSTADSIAAANLPAGPNNPVDGNVSMTMTMPLCRALGIAVFPSGGQPDCTITLETSVMNLSRSGGQNPSFVDLQSVTAHEIDEALGIGGSGSAVGITTSGPVDPLDLFRFSATGVRSFSTLTSAKAYLSINGGATNIVNFNQHGSGSDYGDWGDGVVPADGLPNGVANVQDAYVTPGVDIDVGAKELVALDVVGWNLTASGLALESSAVPEPATCGILAVGGLMLAARRRRLFWSER